MNATRRTTLLALAALVPAGLAGAAHAETKTVEAGKMFPYLDLYLGLPAAQRSRFGPAYSLRHDGQPARDVRLVLLAPGGARTPLPVGPDGRILRIPTLTELAARSKVELTKPDGVKVSLMLDFLARVAPAASLDAADLTGAINQCDAAIKAKAGLLGFAAPKIRRVILHGAGSGTAINAQGAGRALPLMDGHPAFDPEQMPGTLTVKLARAPSAILLSGRPK